MLWLRLAGWLLLRFAERQFCALLFQLPPRNTRFEPTMDALLVLYVCHNGSPELFCVGIFRKRD